MKTRHIISPLAAMILAALLITSLSPAEAKPEPKGQPAQDVYAALDKKGTFEFSDDSLGDVIAFLRDYSGVNIVVNWRAMEISGIEKGTTVTLTLRDVSCKKALEEILATVGAEVELGYFVDEGVVRISTKEDLGTNTRAVVYDVEDLVADEDPDVRADKVEALMEIFSSTIGPESWIHSGGTTGAISQFDAMLVITQTLENHGAVQELLEQLRRAKADRPPRPPSPTQKARQTHLAIKLVGDMKAASFDRSSMGLIAIGGLKDDVRRPPAEIIADLEDQLGRVKTLGLRNAIRLSLRDLYKQTGNNAKVLEHLRAMLAENDARKLGNPAER